MDSVLLIKVISALSYPLGLFFVLVLLRWIARGFGLRSMGGFFGLLAAIVVVISSNPLFAERLASSLEDQYPQQELSAIIKHDAILVLGGGLRLPLPPARHTQIGSASDRYWYAVRLFKAGKADKIILTGGNVFDQPGFQGESFYAAELLQEWGVPKDAIVIETQSRTTEENQRLTADYLRTRNIQSVLLVTSALHMPRAYRVFRKLPAAITPATADVLIRSQFRPAVFDWIPSVSAMHLSTVALHEYYGMWFEQVKALISSGS